MESTSCGLSNHSQTRAAPNVHRYYTISSLLLFTRVRPSSTETGNERPENWTKAHKIMSGDSEGCRLDHIKKGFERGFFSKILRDMLMKDKTVFSTILCMFVDLGLLASFSLFQEDTVVIVWILCKVSFSLLSWINITTPRTFSSVSS